MTNYQQQLSETDLIDSLTFEHPDTKYTYVTMLTTSFYYLLALLMLGVIYIYNMSDNSLYDVYSLLAAVAVIVAGVINVIIMKQACHFRGYAIREKDITYRKGIIFHKIVTIPFSKVQQVSISQGPLARIFGLYSVDITNGAQMLSSLSVDGLSKSTAEAIKQHIINKLSNAAK